MEPLPAPEKISIQNEFNDRNAPHPENRTLPEFFGATAVTGAIAVISLLPVGFTAISTYDDLANLSMDLGSNSPISLGAFLTGVVALVGLYFVIEKDPERYFKDSSGETVQSVTIFVILGVGLLNIYWEYLRVLAQRAIANTCDPKHCTQDQPGTPPETPSQIGSEWELLLPILSPNLILLTLTTCLVVGVCWAAKDSLRLTDRGFKRELRALSSTLQRQKQIARGLADRRIIEIILPGRFPLRKTPSKWKDAFLLTIPLFIIPALVSAGCVLLNSFVPRKLIQSVEYWVGLDPRYSDHFLPVFVLAAISWAALEFAIYLLKRLHVSRGYLASSFETRFTASIFLFFSAIYLLLLTLTAGAAAFVLQIIAIVGRSILYGHQRAYINEIWNDVADSTAESNDLGQKEKLDDTKTPASNHSDATSPTGERKTNGDEKEVDMTNKEFAKTITDLLQEILAAVTENNPTEHDSPKRPRTKRLDRKRRPRGIDLGSRIILQKTIDKLSSDIASQEARLARLQDYSPIGWVDPNLQQSHCQHAEENHHEADEARGGERVLAGTEGTASLESLPGGDGAGVESDHGGGSAE